MSHEGHINLLNFQKWNLHLSLGIAKEDNLTLITCINFTQKHLRKWWESNDDLICVKYNVEVDHSS